MVPRAAVAALPCANLFPGDREVDAVPHSILIASLTASSRPSDRAVGPLIHLSDVDLADDDVRAEAVQVADSN